MQESIGKVVLDTSLYCGQDLYSDGKIEEYLLDVVANHQGEDYAEIIQQNPSWPVIYHLSAQRENILSWYPFVSGKTALEVGAGCGAVTSALLKKQVKVTSVDLSLRRSKINANRHRNYDNLCIRVGNFQDIANNTEEKFDYITLIGVLEYAQSYIQDSHPYQSMLEMIGQLLKPDGRVLIAIENRLGLKYFAGCREDHLGIFFRGVEGYRSEDGVRTFSRRELDSLLEQAGFTSRRFYYPYPDYKLPETIYSDDYLPSCGDLKRNIMNFDADRMVLFDETRAFDGIIQAGLFPEFSNSFLVEAGR